MIAKLESVPDGTTATFERHFKHSVTSVWAYLTDNDLLPEWFSELRVKELRNGGSMVFDMRDGNLIEMRITACKPASVLEYSWGEDKVRFELDAEPEGCRLLLIETIGTLTDHTPKDLAGWHVCLDVIAALLDGGVFQDRKRAWEQQYETYVALVEEYRLS
ncbi:SRPBCC family protein [Paenibacillus tianjinensis]|uniref:SRPBCC family protein n=1 Tax=Paenibacillus tianjinensis TaxID=2810347 RepID=A0ABX7L4V4_9BACL|nr:SRPBCC family protein [Paenibacillus tianjinensis]QSF42804.1 SRPBCC family protein [Paenibacillus tianjinensis]